MVYMKQFTAEGHEAYKEWITGMKSAPSMRINRTLDRGANAEEFTDANGSRVDLDVNREFATAFDFAEYLYSQFSGNAAEKKATVVSIMENEQVADWLIYSYFKQLCSKFSSGANRGRYDVKERARYCLELGGRQKIYRHLVVGRLAVYATYPNIANPSQSLARLCLTHQPHTFGRAMDVISSTEDIFFNAEIMKVLHRLYWDDGEDKPKTNFTDNEHPLVDGCLFRFMGPNSFYDQHYLTHDFRSMDEDEIIALMRGSCGTEFDGWLDEGGAGDADPDEVTADIDPAEES
ncbi:hypothetical protein N9M83_01020 [Candidatus Poseidonia alphae]|nr:hypothetical protein [Candidatus Poseidonia alphae]